MKSIEEFTKIIEPPKNPTNIGPTNNWKIVEQKLGIVFPTDFRLFIEAYGSVYLANFFTIWNPFDSTKFLEIVHETCKIEQELKKEFPEDAPYCIHPKIPGFLPWGHDDNGNYYGWFTQGPPDNWLVLTNEVRGDGYQLYQKTFIGYFLAIFKSDLEALAENYPRQEDYTCQAYT